MRLESIQTGQPRNQGRPGAPDPLDQPWTSAIWKEPVAGRVWVGRDGMAGDAQVDRVHHGGSERALLAYCGAHYRSWREQHGLVAAAGGFGENLTVSGLDETTVCVGDVYRLGDVRLEVSGPREPCMTLVRRHRRPDLLHLVLDTGWGGWYLRVQAEGWLEAGAPVSLLDRPYPQWPVRRALAVKTQRATRRAEALELSSCPGLLADWRQRLGGRSG